MDLSTAPNFERNELSALNAQADVLPKRDASAWEEALDWGVPECSSFGPSEWRMTTAPDFD